MSIYNILCGVRGVTSGSQTYNSPGTFTLDMSVISYNTITIEVYGGGGGAAYYNKNIGYSNGQNGGTSSVSILQGTVQATGGQGGLVFSVSSTGGVGSGPTGTTSSSGGTSAQSTAPVGGTGAGPLGGAGGYWYGTPAGSQAGGGGAAYATDSSGGNYRSVSGGGGGGYAIYTVSAYVGDTITIVVGSGGTSTISNAHGGDGLVKITWS